jgi:hypothetical protein
MPVHAVVILVLLCARSLCLSCQESSASVRGALLAASVQLVLV